MLMSASGLIWDQIQVSRGHDGHVAVLAHILPPQLIWFQEGIIRRERSCSRLSNLEKFSPKVYLPHFFEDLREKLMG